MNASAAAGAMHKPGRGVNGATAIETSRTPARYEGFHRGISSGAAVAAVLRLGERPENAGKTILAIAPLFSERYLSTALFEGIG